MKKYGSTIWLLVILALLPLEWYKSALPYLDENFVQNFYSVNGLQMFIHNFFEILTIYLLCLAIQYLVIKNQRGYLIAAISKILLIGQISFAPISAFYDISIPSISTLKIWLQRANIYIYIYFQSIDLDFSGSPLYSHFNNMGCGVLDSIKKELNLITSEKET